ncbi:Cof-type HAD-IIB family hydrolase [Halalkalibacterium halodurans]|uniref:BH1151 protein n=1 Tax=Halalkalibacterium halodurans (strain ATCC BAA-125 / DSM 18197 / FERM 7344 / JCM 9153 / C-125) TaxID=272558 RepID=Q9KDR0_HALH5|nr:Cof-type HAD-IIB family hydrolase [Halalkalibacterium halodurans]MDY7221683.1 Cof-type HAD-IIB family hydrolase [Halalkalibacterium halodurans]MDY7240959.1 Cof-type HAD-IIB family hydrolase [Halalkalibacterium halodurans]MED4124320.1 Cof-type HAD-IIB family hydrolase [Halalkalibacterium halodurans]MED4171611.1 Cof-type HAD-IIB family hydrolase [Halalkalibacterium halodurans]TES57973.1 Cof-type HAD-IIB family hydrolase [Halalkalibacterium halodurans]
MTYRLLALTIDNAVLRSNGKISRQTKDAIDYVKSKGVYVTIATERPFPAAKKVAKSLKLDGYLISNNGAFVAEASDQPLFARRIQQEKAIHLVELLEQFNCHIRVFHESYAVGNRMNQKNHLIAKMTVGIGDPLFYPVHFVDTVSDQLLKDPFAPLKVQAEFTDDLEKERALRELKAAIPSITISSGEEGRIDIVNYSVSKGRALLRLAQHLGIGPEETVAIGASKADVEMVSQVGLGVAMGNGTKEVKEAAHWVTRTHDQNGVSYMVREVFRKQLRVQL